MNKPKLAVLLAIFVCILCISCQPRIGKNLNATYFSNWPAGTSPGEVGKKVAQNYQARKFQFDEGKFGRLIYPEVCAWYGSLNVAKLEGETGMQQQLIQHYNRFLPIDSNAKYLPTRAHVDYRVVGAVPIEIYLQNKDEKYLKAGLAFADAQWNDPTPDGLTREARYWVDDIYMISLLQVQAYRATGEIKYLDHSAITVAKYLDTLQQPNGLFFHAEDSPFFWGRGNGWYAAGMAELLSELPRSHPQYNRIMKGYKTMMASLLKYQSKEGLWRQLIDKPESWLETSGTGMFAFAMITGVKKGWLNGKIYAPAARKAWLALVNKLDEHGNLKDVCVGTNKAFQEVGGDLQKQLEFYLARKRDKGDLHGQAPVLWTAAALLK